MDNSRFDTLVKVLAARRPRRTALPLLAALSVLGLRDLDDAEAAKSGTCQGTLGECETCTKGKCRRKNGKKRCKAGTIQPKAEGTACSDGSCQSGQCISPTECVPEPLATTCAAGCGNRLNNCNQEVGCVCPSGQVCLVNGTCARPCSTGRQCDDCTPSGLTGCSVPTTEGTQHCIPFGVCEDRPLCDPPDTTGCPLGFQCLVCNPAGTPSNRCVPVAVCPAT